MVGLARVGVNRPTMKTILAALFVFSLSLPAPAQYKPKPLPKDFRALKALADKGNARAQFALGGADVTGKGVPEDKVTAYAWYNIAASNGRADDKKISPFLAFPVILAVVACFIYVRKICPKCKRHWAMETTGKEKSRGGFWDSGNPRAEVKCKYCGYRKWREQMQGH